LLIAAVAMMRFKNVDVVNAATIYFLALFALAPVVHPWYLLWLLAMLPLRSNPFDALGMAALFWTVSVALAYSALYQQQVYGEWHVPGLLLMLQYIPVYVLLASGLVPSPATVAQHSQSRT
jgi:hypothetical protein